MKISAMDQFVFHSYNKNISLKITQRKEEERKEKR